LTATTNAGFAFVDWTENGTPVSSSASFSFPATADRTLVANFTPLYTIAVSALPANGGTMSGGGTFASGTSVTLTATTNAGFAFVNWTENGTPVSTSASFSFAATTDRTLVANFTSLHTITVSALPANGGTVSGGGTFASGTMVTLTATTNAGFAFVNWTENGTPVSSSASFNFAAAADRTLVANFTPLYTITVSAAPANGGTTSGGGSYVNGSNVTVMAVANVGYAFVNWTENGTPVNTSTIFSFTARAERTLVANFVAIHLIATSSSPSAGGTTIGGGIYHSGSNVTVLASASPGYAFVNWTEDGGPVSSSASYSFPATTNRTLVANFTPLYTITVSAVPANGGTVSGGGAFPSGTSVTLTAATNAGFAFVDWTENGTPVSTSASYSFPATTNRTLVANFTPINVTPLYTITITASPSGGGTLRGGGDYTNGASVTVEATANSGYAFVNWTESGVEASRLLSYVFTARTNRTLVANFAPQLQIASAAPNAVMLSWPASATGYVLLQSAVCQGKNWVATTNEANVIDGRSQVTVPSSGGTRFYRLLRP
ncbi:MAG: hypothetical protein HZA90_27525, partial [Verrucomicrobia bacterium]|nr:hypothetical protein [Verrucomicrobiota bacterium]